MHLTVVLLSSCTTSLFPKTEDTVKSDSSEQIDLFQNQYRESLKCVAFFVFKVIDIISISCIEGIFKNS